ncbi:MAG TPA: hypothetical protein VEQ18_05410, partial [Candidatus Nitrosocosmicus sp.]|nr:hypothetical protein [Candidatus Nitrosocosmicus sp.]
MSHRWSITPKSKIKEEREKAAREERARVRALRNIPDPIVKKPNKLIEEILSVPDEGEILDKSIEDIKGKSIVEKVTSITDSSKNLSPSIVIKSIVSEESELTEDQLNTPSIGHLNRIGTIVLDKRGPIDPSSSEILSPSSLKSYKFDVAHLLCEGICISKSPTPAIVDEIKPLSETELTPIEYEVGKESKTLSYHSGQSSPRINRNKVLTQTLLWECVSQLNFYSNDSNRSSFSDRESRASSESIDIESEEETEPLIYQERLEATQLTIDSSDILSIGNQNWQLVPYNPWSLNSLNKPKFSMAAQP